MTMKKNETNIGYQMLPIPVCHASRLKGSHVHGGYAAKEL